VNSQERRELPRVRGAPTSYAELLEEAQFYILCRLIPMQLLNFQPYLLFNTMGSKAYPSGTNVSEGLL
jgi:hypothetical protein